MPRAASCSEGPNPIHIPRLWEGTQITVISCYFQIRPQNFEASLRSSRFLLQYVFFHCPHIFFPLTNCSQATIQYLAEFEPSPSSQILQPKWVGTQKHSLMASYLQELYKLAHLLNLSTEWLLNNSSFSCNHLMPFLSFPNCPDPNHPPQLV